jgi:hypothetical protein
MFASRDSIVSTAPRTGLDGPGGNRRGREIFRIRPDQPVGRPSILCSVYWVSFLGIKRPGRGVDHPPQSSTEVKEMVEQYLYSPLFAFMACYRVNFTFFNFMEIRLFQLIT